MISKPMEEALSEQLNHEFYSAYLYLSMSAYCSHQNFDGAAQWMKLQFVEEHEHATKIYEYLVDQDVSFQLLAIPEPPAEFGSILEVFEASLAHERDMTTRLNELSDQALKEKDHATYNLLQWFVNEQVEEESSLNSIIGKLTLVKDDGYGLLMIDNELGARSPLPTV